MWIIGLLIGLIVGGAFGQEEGAVFGAAIGAIAGLPDPRIAQANNGYSFHRRHGTGHRSRDTVRHGFGFPGGGTAERDASPTGCTINCSRTRHNASRITTGTAGDA